VNLIGVWTEVFGSYSVVAGVVLATIGFSVVISFIGGFLDIYKGVYKDEES